MKKAFIESLFVGLQRHPLRERITKVERIDKFEPTKPQMIKVECIRGKREKG